MMNEKRFKYGRAFPINSDDSLPCITDSEKDKDYFKMSDIVCVLNNQQATISKLEEEKGYWKSKAMTLLMQVCRLTPRMTAKEVIEFGKELEDE